MIDTQWAARVRPDRRGYPLLDRNTWYPVLGSSDIGCIVKIWNKEVFIFAEDVDLRLESDLPLPSTPAIPKASRSSLWSTRRTTGR
jgi:hypothetical protein